MNPFVVANVPSNKGAPSSVSLQNGSVSLNTTDNTTDLGSKKISLRTRTLNNNKQKVNDALGNPIITVRSSSGMSPTRPAPSLRSIISRITSPFSAIRPSATSPACIRMTP